LTNRQIQVKIVVGDHFLKVSAFHDIYEKAFDLREVLSGRYEDTQQSCGQGSGSALTDLKNTGNNFVIMHSQILLINENQMKSMPILLTGQL